MGLVRKYTLSLFAVLMLCLQVVAQNTEVKNLGNSTARASESAYSYARDAATTSFEISISFANNSAKLDASYRDNAIAMQELESFVRSQLREENGTRAIIVEGAASPIGKEEYNKRLALRRAQVVRDFLHTIEGGDRIVIHAVSSGEDWESFARDVLANYNRSNRTEVVEIIRSELSHDEKEAALRRLDKSGKTFRELAAKHMASARNAALIRVVEIADLTPKPTPMTLDITAPALPLPNEVAEEVVGNSVLPSAPTPAKEVRKPVVAVRSNLLVPALNIGVEVPIGTHWSVGADYYYPWIWPKKDNKDCFEFLGWGIEGRYWFGRERTVFDRLQGHSVGLYGYMGYYDFERNYHGYQGEFVNVGLDYTYAMAVGKKKAVHFEFSFGVGYIYSQARKYTVVEANGPLISDKITKMIGFFGPTKANVSLVVPIFQKVSPNDRRRGDE